MRARSRVAVLVLLTLAVLAGAVGPAAAEFARSDSTAKHTVGTYTVTPPTGVVLTSSQCYLVTTTREVTTTGHSQQVRTWQRTEPVETVVHDESTVVHGNKTTTTWKRTRLDVDLRWTASTAKGVTGYEVIGMLPDGTAGPIDATPATATSYSGSADARWLWYGPTLAVRTVTAYGWTADSPQIGGLTC